MLDGIPFLGQCLPSARLPGQNLRILSRSFSRDRERRGKDLLELFDAAADGPELAGIVAEESFEPRCL